MLLQVECMVANLIARKLVRGYVALAQNKIVLAKGPISAAFPKIRPGLL